jgi:hypothetical protein
MKNKLIDSSASIFSLKNFTYDLYLYFVFDRLQNLLRKVMILYLQDLY